VELGISPYENVQIEDNKMLRTIIRPNPIGSNRPDKELLSGSC
jgi:hypothetical protein